MVNECDYSDCEKHKRLGESLKGPALEVIQAVQETNSDASPQDYLKALENNFGSTESGENLYFHFRATCQQTGEKLSDFLRCLERLLRKAVQKGGLESFKANRARVEQLIRGAHPNDLKIVYLRLRERQEDPSSFLTILSEIRNEEEQEAVRHPVDVSVRTVQPAQGPTMACTELVGLKNQIRILEEGMISLMNQVNPASEEPSEGRVRESAPPRSKSAVHRELETELWKQVQELKQDVASLKVDPMVTDKTEILHSQHKAKSESGGTGQWRRPQKTSGWVSFCFQYGKNGHMAAKCDAPENTQLVIKKFTQFTRTQRNSNGAQ
ncbi:zinc finger CCHC domain-containing protein 18-like [Polyodon spathula]|uniref:zinc finger CCHC domain-containing protein 18-like n=1 Tax=Polyodon spathula TaxID=7913 RepID=UPI001B7EBB41|nr:zinc finger CCHC domain-containing protein 18-like [Polyodon spathula]